MKTQNTLLALALSPLCLAAMPAGAVDLLHHGVPNVPANRIVGLWTNQATVRPCGSSQPFNQVMSTILFHAGGTAVANLDSPIGGIPNIAGIPGIHQRGPDAGTWSYDFRTHQYSLKLRFNWYVDNRYHGYSTVDRTVLLSNDGKQTSGPIRVTRYTADGAVIGAQCGEVVSTRI